MDRKVYSVSVPVGSDLYNFLEGNRNNSKFFVNAAEFYLKNEDTEKGVAGLVKKLVKEVSELKSMLSGGVTVNSRKSIGDKAPDIRRGRR